MTDLWYALYALQYFKYRFVCVTLNSVPEGGTFRVSLGTDEYSPTDITWQQNIIVTEVSGK